MDTWILRTVRLSCGCRVAVWMTALAAVVLWGFAQQRYIQNFFKGPYDISAEELAGIGDASRAPRYFVRATGSDAPDTGIRLITIRKRGEVEMGRSVSAGYYALTIGDRLLLCESRSGSQSVMEGELAPIPPELARLLFSTTDTQALQDRYYPYYLTDDSFRRPGYFALAALLVFAYFLIMDGVPAWKHLLDSQSHPAVKRIKTWNVLDNASAMLELEIRSPRYGSSNGWSVTDHFLVRSTLFSFDVLRLADLLWAYKKVRKHRINFIPTGETTYAVLVCYGGKATIKSNETFWTRLLRWAWWMGGSGATLPSRDATDQILAFASQRAPWATFGFSKNLERWFKKDKPAFCAFVERQKREHAQR